MAHRIDESFTVDAPPDRVWSFLIDPARVVECLPGAELVEAVEGRTFRGRMRVKVGPVNVAYEGSAEFVELDEEARRVRIEARGDEASGPGSARMTMESVVAAGADGGSEVRVGAEVDVAGKIVQFGRGMIDTVSGQLFGQFTDCARSKLEEADEEEGGADPEDGGEETGGPEAGGAQAVGGGARGGHPSAPAASGPDRSDDSIDVLSLLLDSFRAWLRRIFGR